MFGRVVSRRVLVGIILLGFCLYIIRLYIQKDINLYIHPRYSLFSLIMCLIAVSVLLAGLVIEVRKDHLAKLNESSGHFIDSLVGLMLLMALVLPAQALSSKAIGRKSLNTPSYGSTSSNTPVETACPETKPGSIEMWVYEIGQYPINCYEGQSIELTGFVLESTETPLPNDMYYLGRVVMSCCVIDARPYALPVKKGNFELYPKETWLKVKGTLQAAKVNGSVQLVIAPENVEKVNNPSKPYDYINVPSNNQAQPLQTIP